MIVLFLSSGHAGKVSFNQATGFGGASSVSAAVAPAAAAGGSAAGVAGVNCLMVIA